MDLKSLSEPQRQALLDLLVLGMYSDGHLAAAEFVKLRQLLGRMGLDSEFDRDRALDASATRVRKAASNSEAARGYATGLTQMFQSKDQRRQVHDLLDDLLGVDNQVAIVESNFSAVVREALRL